MMTDKVVVPGQSAFDEQAKLHYKIRDHMKEMASSFDHQHEAILDKLDKDYVEHYSQWWQNLRTRLLQHADMHDQLGQHLTTAGQVWHEADKDVAQGMNTISSKL
jgi:hypothetical protein